MQKKVIDERMRERLKDGPHHGDWRVKEGNAKS